MKILVVDDEKDVQFLFEQRFRKEIRDKEMQFVFAYSGEEAIMYLNEHDHEVLIKQKFRQKIREHQYEFVFATNGVKALEQLELHHDVDVVLSDINMPEMDGLTLLSRLSEQNGLMKSVIVSAYGDMDNIR